MDGCQVNTVRNTVSGPHLSSSHPLSSTFATADGGHDARPSAGASSPSRAAVGRSASAARTCGPESRRRRRRARCLRRSSPHADPAAAPRARTTAPAPPLLPAPAARPTRRSSPSGGALGLAMPGGSPGGAAHPLPAARPAPQLAAPEGGRSTAAAPLPPPLPRVRPPPTSTRGRSEDGVRKRGAHPSSSRFRFGMRLTRIMEEYSLPGMVPSLAPLIQTP